MLAGDGSDDKSGGTVMYCNNCKKHDKTARQR